MGDWFAAPNNLKLDGLIGFPAVPSGPRRRQTRNPKIKRRAAALISSNDGHLVVAGWL